MRSSLKPGAVVATIPTRRILRHFLRDETGATAIEYGILAAIMGLGVVAGVGGIGDLLRTLFTFVLTGFTTL